MASVLLFAIAGFSQSQTITVTSPNGGESWALGSPQTITWTHSGFTGDVTILLMKEGVRLGIIQDDVPVVSGHVDWVAGQYRGGTAVAGTGYKIRIKRVGTDLMDNSNQPFTLTGLTAREPTPTTPRPLITVTSPNGGEIWSTNAVHEVRWTYIGISGSVTIRLKKGGVVVRSWTAENTGSSFGDYSWAQAGTDYKIRVENSTGSVFDESDRNFTIQVPAGPTPPPPATKVRADLAQTMPAKVTPRIPPKITSFSLNSGAEIIDDLTVTFDYTCTGSPTHYRSRVNPAWGDWQPILPGSQPYGNLLLDVCEQTVYFQVKNEFGESNVVSDSIKTSNYKTQRTISIYQAFEYATGFTFGVIWEDCEGCATTRWVRSAEDYCFECYLGYLDSFYETQTRGMKADYELFGGGRLLKPGWHFVSFGMPEITQVGNPDGLDAQGASISYQPPPGGRDIRLRIHLWRNIFSAAATFKVYTITLLGPCTEDVSEAFK